MFDYFKIIYIKLSVWSLRAWKKLKEVLQSWIHTSGQDDQSEKNTVCQEIKEVRLFSSLLKTKIKVYVEKLAMKAKRF